MLRSELVEVLANRQPHLSQRDVELAVNCIIGMMSQAIASGERIEVRGFGGFTLRQRPARKARNPKTGETVYLQAKATVHFKPGKEMRDRVNDSRDQYRISRE